MIGEGNRFFIFGDIHFPFHEKVALAIAIDACIRMKPDYIIQVGDMRDWYSATKFPRKVNLFTPKEEDSLATEQAKIFWAILCKFLPKAKKFQLLGNHCIRPMKRILEKAPEFEEYLKDAVEERYTFRGVKTIFDPREELDLHGIRFMHGYMTKLGDHCSYNQMPCVVGHTHRGGVVFQPQRDRIIFELNAGYLGDPSHPALSYTMQKKGSKWTHGFAIIDDSGPRFNSISADDIYGALRSKSLSKFFI